MKRVVDEVIFAADVNVTVTRTINTEQSGRSCNTLRDVCVRLSEHELMTVWRSACRCLSMYREDPVEAARVFFFLPHPELLVQCSLERMGVSQRRESVSRRIELVSRLIGSDFFGLVIEARLRCGICPMFPC